MPISTETETVIKKILPYLYRRGYDLDDLDFETAVSTTTRYAKGYIDILVNVNRRGNPQFLVEAKRIAHRLTANDRDQAIAYAKGLDIPFVVVTNGVDVQCFNTKTKTPLTWDGSRIEKIPSKSQLVGVMRSLRANPAETNFGLGLDGSLPFRPGLTLRQLNALFARIHNKIRKIEKNEDHAFADFSKVMFMKLLEEKHDLDPSSPLPYSYRFYKMAELGPAEADQVKDAIERMQDAIVRRTPYGDVLSEPLHSRNARTFQSIVKELAAVSFADSGYDSKGAAFEYFVRATLRGKKLGQYFTPRTLVQLMYAVVGPDKITNHLLAGQQLKILDPACGTGGFLVWLMQASIYKLDAKLAARTINAATHKRIVNELKTSVFYGSDANPGVAASAKMNMIIAGDGHTNIKCEDSLAADATNWSMNPSCHFIFTNPPFGTSESESLGSADLQQFPIRGTKGQHLFIQKIVLSTLPEGEICTVIDEGVLNTDSAVELRKWVLQKCRLNAVIRLPDETFKPNKINVRSSVLYLTRLAEDDVDGELDYPIAFIDLRTLGYNGAGDPIRGFDLDRLVSDAAERWTIGGSPRSGEGWSAFDVNVSEVRSDPSHRFDLKYWEPTAKSKIAEMMAAGAPSISDINLIPTDRGRSPPAEAYVDAADGYAVVIKAGSNISKFGQITFEGADWIEKSIYDEFKAKAEIEGRNLNLVQDGDVLVSSTGDGTLGKCSVYRGTQPAVADGHVSIIRCDPSVVVPEYLADYLRAGFGAVQIARLYTGSTGLIELTKEALALVYVDLLSGTDEQRRMSEMLRQAEQRYRTDLENLQVDLSEAYSSFAGAPMPVASLPLAVDQEPNLNDE